MPKYTRTETVEAWQWNGRKDDRDAVYEAAGFLESQCHCGNSNPAIHGCLWRPYNGESTQLCLGDWIIERGGRYKGISDAEFKAQGWKEVE